MLQLTQHLLLCLACKDKPAFPRYFESCNIPGCTSPTADQENLLQKQNHWISASSSTSKDENKCHQPHFPHPGWVRKLPVKPTCTPKRPYNVLGPYCCWHFVTSLNNLSDPRVSRCQWQVQECRANHIARAPGAEGCRLLLLVERLRLEKTTSFWCPILPIGNTGQRKEARLELAQFTKSNKYVLFHFKECFFHFPQASVGHTWPNWMPQRNNTSRWTLHSLKRVINQACISKAGLDK